MKRVRFLFGILIVAAAVASIVWYVWNQNADALPVGLASGNGRIEAEQIDIATKAPGRVKEIRVREGDLVEAGAVIAIMDTSELDAQRARALADHARAESQVEEVKALIAQRYAELALAEEEFARAQTLSERGVSPKANADRMRTRVSTARAVLNATEAQLNTVRRGVEAAQALVVQYETQIADATLTAPTRGRVLYRLAQQGEVLGGGGKVITLLDLSRVFMEVFLPERQSMQVAIGAEARIKIDGIPYAIPAFTSFVSPQAQFTPKQVETRDEREKLMFRVKVRVPEELVLKYIDQVKTGMRGVAFIKLPGSEAMPWPAEFVGQPLPDDVFPSGS